MSEFVNVPELKFSDWDGKTRPMYAWNDFSLSARIDIIIGHANGKWIGIGNEKPYLIIEYSHVGEIDGCGQSDWKRARRATNRELAQWLAQGKGEFKYTFHQVNNCETTFKYDELCGDATVCNELMVRTWDDIEWHEPTARYLGVTHHNAATIGL